MQQRSPRVLVPQRISVGADPRVQLAEQLFHQIVAHLTGVGFDAVITDDPAVSLADIDALVLPGGGDVDPARYHGDPTETVYDVNRSQDALDFTHLDRAIAAGLPVLGICRGAQVINIHYGGDLVVDLPATATEHRGPDGFAWHAVDLVPGTATQLAHGSDRITVASAHHQAIRRLGDGLRVTGAAPDGIVEACEAEAGWVKAVQWHPEATSTPITVATAMFRSLRDVVDR